MAAISTVSFPGLHQIQSASITLTDGVLPSVCLITCAIPNTFPLKPDGIGALHMTYREDGSTFLRMPDCAVSRAISSQAEVGDTVTFQILDRRWKWKLAWPVSGRYNVRDPRGVIDTDTEKTPQELAELLFDALDEYDYSVTDLPNETRPEIDWIDASPRDALASLVDDLGCVIVPQLSGSFAIRKRNSGQPHQVDETHAMKKGVSYQSPVRPARVLVTGALLRVQAKFELEAVGLDTDDKIRPLAELTYRPENGFNDPSVLEIILRNDNPSMGAVELNDIISRAVLSVYRWYRVTQPVGGWDTIGNAARDLSPEAPVNPGGVGVSKLEQVLPLSIDLIETETDPDGRVVPKQGYTLGEYWTGSMDDVITDKDTPLPYAFTLMGDKGIVAFNEPVVSIGFDAAGDRSAENLRLVCTCNVINDEGERVVTRLVGPAFEQENETAYGVHVLRIPELEATRRIEYDGDSVTGLDDNDSFIAEEAARYWANAQTQFGGEYGGAIEYAGLIPIEMDGAIRQVTYSVSLDGTRTTLSANATHNPYVPTDNQKKKTLEEGKLERRMAYQLANYRRRKDYENRHSVN